MKFKSLLIMLGLAFIIQGSMFASPDAVNLEDHKEGIISLEDAGAMHMWTKNEMKEAKKLERAQKRTQKKMAKFQKFMDSKLGQKMMGGMDDPVDKWFWYWVIGWGAAIVLIIIGSAITVGTLGAGFGIGSIFFLIGWLAGLFGSVSLIIWLIKKFS